MNGSADSTKIFFTPNFCEKFSSYLLHLPPCLDLKSNRQVKKETLARAETCFAKFRPKSFFFWQTFSSWFPPGQARKEQNCPFQRRWTIIALRNLIFYIWSNIELTCHECSFMSQITNYKEKM